MDKGFIKNICLKYFEKDYFNNGTTYTAQRLYIEIFRTIPDRYIISYNKDKSIRIIKNGNTCLNEEYPESDREVGININELVRNLSKDTNIVQIPITCSFNLGTMFIGNNFIFINYTHANGKVNLDSIEIYCNDKNIKNFIAYLPDFIEIVEKAYRYVTISSDGTFDTIVFKIRNNSVVSLDNYNDDCPYNKLLKFCNDEGCGLSLLYGKPGTGKTTLIKKLISNSSARFFLLDASLLGNIVSSNFVEFLMNDCKNSVFILEDCEKLLIDRTIEHNPWIGTILNLTDGMLGEGMNIRFICTFNAPVDSIDPALRRKGRLKISYEFKSLCKEKVEKLAKELNKDIHGEMTLAEIYGEDYEVSGKLTTNRKKIGF